MSPTTTSASSRKPSNAKDTATKDAPKSSVIETPAFTIQIGNPEAEAAALDAEEALAEQNAERAEMAED